jgi:hypothetical protein
MPYVTFATIMYFFFSILSFQQLCLLDLNHAFLYVLDNSVDVTVIDLNQHPITKLLHTLTFENSLHDYKCPYEKLFVFFW